MKGKERCKILKDIRKRIADENDIEFITSECKHKGDCLGTCPKCESELRYLERELEKRRTLGKKVTVAGLAISVTLATSSCVSDLFSQPTAGVLMPPDGSEEIHSEISDGEMMPLDGETEATDAPPFKGLLVETEEPLMGDVPPDYPDIEDESELMGAPIDIPGELVDPDLWEGELVPEDQYETETDAPVSENEETVAETPVEEDR